MLGVRRLRSALGRWAPLADRYARVGFATQSAEQERTPKTAFVMVNMGGPENLDGVGPFLHK